MIFYQQENFLENTSTEEIGTFANRTFSVPDHWLHLDYQSRVNSKITDDFCFIKDADGEVARYIRCTLEVKSFSADAEDSLRLDVWMAVSEQIWHMYWRGFRTGKYQQAAFTGYLANTLSGYANSHNLPVKIYFGPAYERPMGRLEVCFPLHGLEQNSPAVLDIDDHASKVLN